MAEVHEVAPDGDVRLIFGSEEKGNCTHILVSSVFLSFGSPVFKAMLGPHFKEGATLASGTRLDLPLPEDCPGAMLAICEVMHMKTSTCSIPSVDSLLQVALLVDKYDCRAAMSYAMKDWMRLAKSKCLDRNILNLFIIAYLMEFSKSFTKYGCALVANTEPEFKLTPPDYIPETLQRTIGKNTQRVAPAIEERTDFEIRGSDRRGVRRK
ncbi:hypothetical protein CB0940_06582 [Cercospora beticola]|uniref:BTB domain-containing protein n=1 Tax=Cercospora beticola TaxID=122368 RepID=A0A2G5I085_CERBT|nr:hypothetical protein CB0940_06582 [Cercospora beticola]PIA98225.1 hypothetical protein CB0940_06582 [Cercospora beticola]WPA99228.1 hypothetical protein RHO25_003844 [Cercospora beticola]